MTRDFSQVREDFPVLEDLAYLQTGSYGPMPEPVRRKLESTRRRYNALGPASPRGAEFLGEKVKKARKSIASSVESSPDDVAWLGNVTSGFDVLALGLDWERDDEVIVASSEHIAGRMPWARLAREVGVKVVEIEVGPKTRWQVPPQAVEEAMTNKTRLICLSDISYCTGARLRVSAIAALAEENDVLFAVDGAQTVGAVPISAEDSGCHFYSYCGYKWSLGPAGTGALYVSPQVTDDVSVHRVGSRGTEMVKSDGTYRLRSDARKFEGTTYSKLNYVGWGIAFDYIADIGVDRCYERIERLAGLLKKELAAIDGVSVLTPASPRLSGGLVSFAVPGLSDLGAAVEELYSRHDVLIRYTGSTGALRASVHFFNDESDLERLLKGIKELT